MESSSVVVDYLNVQRIASDEVKANTPSGIHGHRPLTSPVSLEPMQADTVQNAQIGRRPCNVQGQ
jgi:hypothetical protein